ncbi:MAG: DNA mismatch repair endonuclease MutL [Erysipelotrichaceae bacterium]
MAIIHRLDEHLTNMIAAGEVVERPMGVVKELVENSLDAHATYITIRITEGGIDSIEVEDNGNGMDSTDALLAFERHSTSKISTQNDLFSIHTLGFRGEALPSIASVSKTTLTTSDGKEATYVQIDYGTRSMVRPHACAQGTTIRVESLFRKTPARLKHLKTPQYEASITTDLIEKFALCYPEVAFKLIADEKTVLETSGNGQLIDCIARTLSSPVARLAKEFSAADYDFAITGAFILPSQSRSNNKGIFIFLNHRIIRSWQIQKAVMEAYRPFLSPDRFPIIVLHIRTDSSLVDVNIHPSKWEIRLSKEQQLFYLIVDQLSAYLRAYMAAPAVKLATSDPVMVQDPLFNVDHPDFYPAVNQYQIQPEVREEPIAVPASHPIENASVFPHLTVLAQLHGRYILASASDGLYIIDQHAAKERVNYEKFQELLLHSASSFQTLTIPILIETKASVMARFEELQDLLKQIDITIERLSGNSLLVRTLPLWLNDVDETAFLNDMVDSFESQRSISLEKVRADALASLACHASIRFNKALTLPEMSNIVNELAQCRQPFNCPHGRPTFIKLSDEQLFKEFGR